MSIVDVDLFHSILSLEEVFCLFFYNTFFEAHGPPLSPLFLHNIKINMVALNDGVNMNISYFMS